MNLVDKLMDRFEEIVNSFHSVGQVTAVTPPRATVNIAGGLCSLPYPTHYTPVVGDVVQVIGRPGAKFIAAKLV